jgi:hypothetical protein
MTVKGRYQNGTILLASDAPVLPEGTVVDVVVPEPHLRGVLADLADEFGGQIDHLPADFAEQHDHYIHGTPKKNSP